MLNSCQNQINHSVLFRISIHLFLMLLMLSVLWEPPEKISAAPCMVIPAVMVAYMVIPSLSDDTIVSVVPSYTPHLRYHADFSGLLIFVYFRNRVSIAMGCVPCIA